MTQVEFTAFYPQFAGFTPAIVLSTYIAQANARFETFSPEDAEEARRLYAAHRLTMYAMSFPDEAPSASSIVAAPHSGDGSFQMTSHSEGISATGGLGMFARIRQAQQKIASKKVGEVSVTYATGASSSSVSASSDLADLTETSFGLQLLSLLRLYSMTRYVP